MPFYEERGQYALSLLSFGKNRELIVQPPGSGVTSSECASWYRMGCFFIPSPPLLKVDNYSDMAVIDEEDASLSLLYSAICGLSIRGCVYETIRIPFPERTDSRAEGALSRVCGYEAGLGAYSGHSRPSGAERQSLGGAGGQARRTRKSPAESGALRSQAERHVLRTIHIPRKQGGGSQ